MQLIVSTFATLALLLAVASASAGTIQIEVNGLVCGFCAQGIEKTLRKFEQTSDVLVSLEDRLVAIELVGATDIDDAALRSAIANSGYAVKSIRRSTESLDAVRARLAEKTR